MIGNLLGHNHVYATARHSHLARNTLYEARERIADSTAPNNL